MLSECDFVIFLMSLELWSPCVFNYFGRSTNILKHFFCGAVHGAEINISWIDILNEREVLVTLSQSCCLECFYYTLNTHFWPFNRENLLKKYNSVITINCHLVPNLYVLYTTMASKYFYTSEYFLLCSVQICIDMRVSSDDRIFIFRWTIPLNSISNTISNLTQVAVTQKLSSCSYSCTSFS